MITLNSDKICLPSFTGNAKNERVYAKYRPDLLPESVITINSDKTCGRVFPYAIHSAIESILFAFSLNFYAFLRCLCHVFFYAQVPCFLTLARTRRGPPIFGFSGVRNTLPLTGGWVAGVAGWAVVAGWLVAGCWVWIIGFDMSFGYQIYMNLT